MNYQTFKQERQKIEFEALGKVNIAYCPMNFEEEVILWTLSFITPTAHVISISTDLIDDETFQEKHIDNIINHHNNVMSYEEAN